jgi:rubrerythrin
MSLFEPSEIFQFAIRIEENGEKYYRQMAQKLNDDEIKQLFNSLADDEVKHKQIYQDMVSKIEKYEPFENYPGEYFEYLRAYADNIIFDEKSFDKKISQINDKISALDFAINNEMASVLYYEEIKKLVPENKRNAIDKIIEEERRHFVRLSGIKRSIK